MEEFNECEENEDLDPRIQHELDTLNRASSDINVLERSLEEERQNYDNLFSSVTQNLTFLHGKLNSAIEKTRSYYEIKEKLKEAHAEAQTAAKRYDRAISTHQAAQQMVAVAETGFQNSVRAAHQAAAAANITSKKIVNIANSGNDPTATSVAVSSQSTSGSPRSTPVNIVGKASFQAKDSTLSNTLVNSFEFSSPSASLPSSTCATPPFDLAWQEMLNVAVSKVYEAERELTLSEQQHEYKMKQCHAITEQLKRVEKSLKSSIKKSRPYYEAKTFSSFQLEEQLRRIKHIESKISESKQKYATALCNLEAISEEIHFRRESKLGPRGQGVGAESESVGDDVIDHDKAAALLTTPEPQKSRVVNNSTQKSISPTNSFLTTPSHTNDKAVNASSERRKEPIGADFVSAVTCTQSSAEAVDLHTPKGAIDDLLLGKVVETGDDRFGQLTPEDAKSIAQGKKLASEYFPNIQRELTTESLIDNRLSALLEDKLNVNKLSAQHCSTFSNSFPKLFTSTQNISGEFDDTESFSTNSAASSSAVSTPSGSFKSGRAHFDFSSNRSSRSQTQNDTDNISTKARSTSLKRTRSNEFICSNTFN